LRATVIVACASTRSIYPATLNAVLVNIPVGDAAAAAAADVALVMVQRVSVRSGMVDCRMP
jgi:hypothetical protein